jgi:hypothetical protein
VPKFSAENTGLVPKKKGKCRNLIKIPKLFRHIAPVPKLFRHSDATAEITPSSAEKALKCRKKGGEVPKEKAFGQ